MPTVGTFTYFVNPQNDSRRTIGMVCQTEKGGLFNTARHIILADTKGKGAVKNYIFTTAQYPLQEALISYFKETIALQSTRNFNKLDFQTQQQTKLSLVPAVHIYPEEKATLITSLTQLESILENFLPLSEYQYASIIRVFKTFHRDFQSSTTPRLSL